MSSYFIIEKREDIINKIDEFLDYVCVNCFCCNRCWHCSVIYKLQREASKKGLQSFNSYSKWWSIEWIKEGEHYMPKFFYHYC